MINFLEWKYGKSDIDIKELNHRFITEFDFYMRSERKCNNNSTAKYIKNFRKVIRICITNDWLQKDPFANFKIKIKEPERSFLSQEELTKIEEKKFLMPRMNQVKDIFLFSCYTGLAYVDVQKLTKSNIVVGIDRRYWHDNWLITKTKIQLPQSHTVL